MIRLIVMLVCITLGILFVPEQWRQEGRKFIRHYTDRIKAPLFEEVQRFKRVINDSPAPFAGLSPKPSDDSSLPFHKEDVGDCEETLELEEKVFHSLKLLDGDDDQ